MMFGEQVSSRFVSKWPTFFKPRILEEHKDWCGSDRMDAILSEDGRFNCFFFFFVIFVNLNIYILISILMFFLGWDSDLSSVLLLLHMLPPTPKGTKKSAKISTSQAINKLVKYLQVCSFPFKDSGIYYHPTMNI